MKYKSTQPCYIVMGLCTMKGFTDSKSTCTYRSTAKPHTMHKTEQHIYIIMDNDSHQLLADWYFIYIHTHRVQSTYTGGHG